MIYIAQVGSFHNVLCATQAAIENGFNNKNDIIHFLIHREPLFIKWKHVDKILRLRNINSEKIFCETINEKTLSRIKIEEMKKKITSKIEMVDVLITQFNFGINHTLIKNIFDIKKLILIDDGLMNCSKITQKFALLKYLQYKIIGLEYNLRDKFKLGLSKNYDNYYTCIDKRFLCSINRKTLNISNQVSIYYKDVIKSDQKHFDLISSDNSLLFCSNHSVQSKRIDEKNYYKIIDNKINYIRSKYKIKNLYICMHPAEPIKNFDFYSSLGFKNLNKYSAELYLQTNRFSFCVHPSNSVPLVSESISKTKTKYIGYLLPGMAYKNIGTEINKNFNFEFLSS
tara:strand:+ start:2851 stop:3873 length:1023 start_codon:yes stop_codon:yes gene_type:complete